MRRHAIRSKRKRGKACSPSSNDHGRAPARRSCPSTIRFPSTRNSTVRMIATASFTRCLDLRTSGPCAHHDIAKPSPGCGAGSACPIAASTLAANVVRRRTSPMRHARGCSACSFRGDRHAWSLRHRQRRRRAMDTGSRDACPARARTRPRPRTRRWVARVHRRLRPPHDLHPMRDTLWRRRPGPMPSPDPARRPAPPQAPAARSHIRAPRHHGPIPPRPRAQRAAACGG